MADPDPEPEPEPEPDPALRPFGPRGGQKQPRPRSAQGQPRAQRLFRLIDYLQLPQVEPAHEVLDALVPVALQQSPLVLQVESQ